MSLLYNDEVRVLQKEPDKYSVWLYEGGVNHSQLKDSPYRVGGSNSLIKARKMAIDKILKQENGDVIEVEEALTGDVKSAYCRFSGEAREIMVSAWLSGQIVFI